MTSAAPVPIHDLPERYVAQLCLQARRLSAVPRLAMASRGDAERLLHLACGEGLTLFDAAGVAVLLDDGKGQLRVRASAGFGDRFARWASLPAAHMAELCERDGEVTVLDGSPGQQARLPEEALETGVGNALWAQIRQSGRITGGLLVANRDGNSNFNEDDRVFAELLASYLGARLLELQLKQTLLRTHEASSRAARLSLTTELTAVAAGEMAIPSAEIAGEATRSLALLPEGSPLRPGQEAIRRDSRRLAALASTLRDFARSDSEGLCSTPPAELIASSMRLLSRQTALDDIELMTTLEPGLPPVRCRRAQVSQALVYLFVRLRQALVHEAPPAGEEPPAPRVLCLSARSVLVDRSRFLEVLGWDERRAGKVRTLRAVPEIEKQSGIRAAEAIVREHGGSLEVDHAEGGLSRFVLRLPLEVSK